MITLRLFAQARQLAGEARVELDTGSDDTTVAQILELVVDRYGAEFGELLRLCKVWVNGEQAAEESVVRAGDELAILPPVSGG